MVTLLLLINLLAGLGSGFGDVGDQCTDDSQCQFVGCGPSFVGNYYVCGGKGVSCFKDNHCVGANVNCGAKAGCSEAKICGGIGATCEYDKHCFLQHCGNGQCGDNIGESCIDDDGCINSECAICGDLGSGCQLGDYSDSGRFYFQPDTVQNDWIYADEKCIENGGRLAVISNEDENALANAAQYGVYNAWIGLKNPNYVDGWIDGSTLDYSNFGGSVVPGCIIMNRNTGLWENVAVNQPQHADQCGRNRMSLCQCIVAGGVAEEGGYDICCPGLTAKDGICESICGGLGSTCQDSTECVDELQCGEDFLCGGGLGTSCEGDDNCHGVLACGTADDKKCGGVGAICDRPDACMAHLDCGIDEHCGGQMAWCDPLSDDCMEGYNCSPDNRCAYLGSECQGPDACIVHLDCGDDNQCGGQVAWCGRSDDCMEGYSCSPDNRCAYLGSECQGSDENCAYPLKCGVTDDDQTCGGFLVECNSNSDCKSGLVCDGKSSKRCIGSDKSYFMSGGKTNYCTKANDICQTAGGSGAKISTDAENELARLLYTLDNWNEPLIAFQQFGQPPKWIWYDGSDVEYTSWSSNPPSYTNCAVFASNGKWISIHLTTGQMKVLCECTTNGVVLESGDKCCSDEAATAGDICP